MRQIGSLEDERLASTLGDFLYVNGIKNNIEEDEGSWLVWVYDEEKLQDARKMMDEFLADPEKPEYRQFRKKAEALRTEEEKEEEAYRKQVEANRAQQRNIIHNRLGPVTKIFIVISVIVFILSNFGGNWEYVRFFSITNYFVDSDIGGSRISWYRGLPEVFDGQVWRLFTPMFIHGDVMHIAFNMLWLGFLGREVENRHSSTYMIFLSLLIATISNLGQYIISGPSFGGMSGVVYGLLGYIWIRGKFDPASGLYIHTIIVQLMIVFFFVGLVGIIPNVANTAHGVGLAVGMAWGYISGQNSKYLRKL